MLIIDEHMHYHWVEFLKKKSNAFTQLQKWKLQAEREVDLKVQFLKSDGGMEFRSKAFEDWLSAEGVLHEKSAPYKHEQNGLAERGIQNVSQQAMCQLFSANMSEGFWPYAVETAIYLINRSPTTTLDNKTPFEAWMDKHPNIKHLWTFGETGYVHIPPETCKKWSTKSCPCRLLGYSSRLRNYKMWDSECHTVVISPNVDFDELSASSTTSSKQGLDDLKNIFEVEGAMYKMANGDANEWESDEEVL